MSSRRVDESFTFPIVLSTFESNFRSLSCCGHIFFCFQSCTKVIAIDFSLLSYVPTRTNCTCDAKKIAYKIFEITLLKKIMGYSTSNYCPVIPIYLVMIHSAKKPLIHKWLHTLMVEMRRSAYGKK